MARGSGHQAIEAIGGGGADDDGLTPGLRAWQRYMEMQDAEPAAADDAAAREQRLEEERRAGRIGGPEPVREPSALRDLGPIGAGAVAAMQGAASAIDGRANDRTSAMLAMQAEALARLELAPHADAVNAGIREAEGLDEGNRIGRQDEHLRRFQDGRLEDREQQKAPDALARPDDYVSGIDGPEHRSQAEKREDALHHAQRGLGRDEAWGTAQAAIGEAAGPAGGLDAATERGLARLREAARGTDAEKVVGFLEELLRDADDGKLAALVLTFLRKVGESDGAESFELVTMLATAGGGGGGLDVAENRKAMTLAKAQVADLLEDALARAGRQGGPAGPGGPGGPAAAGGAAR